MGSTVRIEDDDKDRLRRLQEAWSQLAGERPSQKELIGRGLAYLERHKDDFLSESAWRPFSSADLHALKDRVIVSVGEGKPYDIDAVVYDEPAVTGRPDEDARGEP